MFNPLKLLVIFASFVIFTGFMVASADADDWRLSNPEGVVRVMLPGAAIARGRDQMILPPGTVITTGRDGSVVVLRGEQQIDVAADTRLTVAASAKGMTTIRQDTGAAFYQVDSKAMPHFRVETSLLAAVVKGTGFTVSAGPDAHMVHVAHGLVEVQAPNGNASADVHPGETARVERMTPADIVVDVPQEASVAPALLDVPAIDYANASDNLLQSAGSSGNSANRAAQAKPGMSVQQAEIESQGSQNMSSVAALAVLDRPAAGNGNGNAANANAGGNGNGNAGSENAAANGNANAGNENAAANDNANANAGNENAAANGNANAGNENAAANGNANAGNENAAANGNANAGNENAAANGNANAGNENAAANGNANAAAEPPGGNGNGNAATEAPGGNGNGNPANENTGGNANGNGNADTSERPPTPPKGPKL